MFAHKNMPFPAVKMTFQPYQTPAATYSVPMPPSQFMQFPTRQSVSQFNQEEAQVPPANTAMNGNIMQALISLLNRIIANQAVATQQAVPGSLQK